MCLFSSWFLPLFKHLGFGTVFLLEDEQNHKKEGMSIKGVIKCKVEPKPSAHYDICKFFSRQLYMPSYQKKPLQKYIECCTEFFQS